MEWEVRAVEDLLGVADALLQEAGSHRVFCLHGEMGAGKTTFITALCRALGVEDAVSSPTFSIVQEYLGGDGKPVFHFDFYRIEKVEEAFDLGAEEYLYSGNYCFIEWPEKVESLLNLPKADIFITVDEGVRKIRTHYD